MHMSAAAPSSLCNYCCFHSLGLSLLIFMHLFLCAKDFSCLSVAVFFLGPGHGSNLLILLLIKSNKSDKKYFP